MVARLSKCHASSLTVIIIIIADSITDLGTIRLTGNCYLLYHTFMCHSIKMSVMEGVNVLKVIFELYSDLSKNTIKTSTSSNAQGQ